MDRLVITFILQVFVKKINIKIFPPYSSFEINACPILDLMYFVHRGLVSMLSICLFRQNNWIEYRLPRYLNSIRQILDKMSICWELEQILGSPKSPHIISDFVSKTKSTTLSSGCLNNP